MYEDYKEVADAVIKFGAAGDQLAGTLTEVTKFDGEFGTAHKYIVLADGGSFHDIVDKQPVSEATAVQAGESYSFLASLESMLDEKMAKAKLGQKVLVTMLGEQKTQDKKRTYKNWSVKLGPIDTAYGFKEVSAEDIAM